MGLAKNLVFAVGLSMLWSSAISQTLPQNFNLPEKFQNYRRNAVSIFELDNYLFRGRVYSQGVFYNLDGDDCPDVLELYLSPNHLNPIFFRFDLESDCRFDRDYFDGEGDWISGNEVKVD